MTFPGEHNRAHYTAGCRHPDCLTANAAYMARWREERRRNAPPKDATLLEQALDLIETAAVTGDRMSVGANSAAPEVVGPCIPWPGYRDRAGYGRASSRLAHRIVYERLVGPIPDGLTVDHMCFNTACVNPVHLRLLTPADNTRSRRITLRTQCKQGHWLTPENTYFRPNGGRTCRACNRISARNYSERKAAA